MTSRMRFQRKRRALGSIPVVGSSCRTDSTLRHVSPRGDPATSFSPFHTPGHWWQSQVQAAPSQGHFSTLAQCQPQGHGGCPPPWAGCWSPGRTRKMKAGYPISAMAVDSFLLLPPL